ncbi:MAG: acetate kinase [Verrucomicrobiae bacterium]|nr:acetate kinase [Verrucomicrobiae bacterium]
MKILVANLGSTSLKYRLFDFEGGGERQLAKGGFERVEDHSSAIDSCLAGLKQGGFVRSASDVAAVGFKTILARGVNGCVRLDESVLAAMEACYGLAPAHNPPYVQGIRSFAKKMPGTPLVALFETSFYQWAPPAALRYAVPGEWHEWGVRRWGFHGASHKYIAERSAEMLGRQDVAERVRQLYVSGPGSEPAKPDLRVISCHLGGSSSITGILNGLAIGNSMGMSPQSGLPQNNRVGDLDSSAVPYLIREKGMTVEQVEKILSKESGLKGVSGGFNDVRDLQEQAARGNGQARLAMDVLIHSARHWIGSYAWQMNGLDALVFTGGIGENDGAIRRGICANLENFGLLLDDAANDRTRREEAVISRSDSKIKIMIIPANEELVVAREVKRHLQAKRGK